MANVDETTTRYLSDTKKKKRSLKYFKSQEVLIPSYKKPSSRSLSPDRDQFIWSEKETRTTEEDVDKFQKACPHYDLYTTLCFLGRNDLETAIKKGKRGVTESLVPKQVKNWTSRLLESKKETFVVEDIPPPENNKTSMKTCPVVKMFKTIVDPSRLLGVGTTLQNFVSPFIKIDILPRKYESSLKILLDPSEQSVHSVVHGTARSSRYNARNNSSTCNTRSVAIKEEINAEQNHSGRSVQRHRTIKRELADTSGEGEPENRRIKLETANGEQFSARSMRLMLRNMKLELKTEAVEEGAPLDQYDPVPQEPNLSGSHEASTAGSQGPSSSRLHGPYSLRKTQKDIKTDIKIKTEIKTEAVEEAAPVNQRVQAPQEPNSLESQEASNSGSQGPSSSRSHGPYSLQKIKTEIKTEVVEEVAHFNGFVYVPQEPTSSGYQGPSMSRSNGPYSLRDIKQEINIKTEKPDY
ncbi:hypothetical protein GCK72_024068 [Caenorhabditis remanei]|uniref:Uncharacterized protein n=1 Tax=Caenorhabditis remanei TaxID=31234 RepID=A0A6A5FYH1_CAERE|nr:hypothetical protein GCK72_024068 [Caenorhabditis remanei]KAF1747603.1 hypothetical protein GCK72_024068 [Caenorhabditis remanei]